MRKKSKPLSNYSKPKLHPRSAGNVDIEMGAEIRLRRVDIGLLAKSSRLVFSRCVQKYEKGVSRVGALPLQQITLTAMTDVGHGQPLPLIEEASIERCCWRKEVIHRKRRRSSYP
jgi:hypothetical protein